MTADEFAQQVWADLERALQATYPSWQVHVTTAGRFPQTVVKIRTDHPEHTGSAEYPIWGDDGTTDAASWDSPERVVLEMLTWWWEGDRS